MRRVSLKISVIRTTHVTFCDLEKQLTVLILYVIVLRFSGLDELTSYDDHDGI